MLGADSTCFCPFCSYRLKTRAVRPFLRTTVDLQLDRNRHQQCCGAGPFLTGSGYLFFSPAPDPIKSRLLTI